jgi:hypothetical protein
MTEAIIAIIALIAVAIGAYRRGKSDTEDQHEIDTHNEYIATKKRIEGTPIGGSTDDLRQRMRDRPTDQR